MSVVSTLTLFTMMLALGMTLSVEDFKRLGSARAAVALGLTGQFVVLPLLAFMLATALRLSATQAIGIVLIASCPGGVVSNALSLLARGNVALSISLTAFSSVACFVTMPLVVGFAVEHFTRTTDPIRLSFLDTASTLFLTTALPVLLGMATRQWRRHLADRLHRPLLLLSSIVLVLLLLGLSVAISLAADDLSLLTLFAETAPAVIALIALAMGATWAAGRLLRQGSETIRTLTLEVGLQNFNLALVVALVLLGEQRYAGPALVYLPVMFVFAVPVVLHERFRTDRRSQSST